MSTRLFIDCDDTLILWQSPPNPQGVYLGSEWQANTRLIAGIEEFAIADPNALIVVWSGGGKDYAQMWIDRLLDKLGCAAFAKDKEMARSLIRKGDIVVDDFVDFPCAGTVYGPNDWPIPEKEVSQ